MLVFEERGKPEYPEKNLSEQGREPTTNSTHIWRRRRDLDPGHIGGRRVLSPLRHSLILKVITVVNSSSFRIESKQKLIKLVLACLKSQEKQTQKKINFD